MARHAAILLTVLVGMFLLHLFNSLSSGVLNQWGLVPRSVEALPGILWSPWLHRDWAHLFNNLGALAVLSGLLLVRQGLCGFITCSLFIVLGSGVLVWCLGRPAVHIGASGWIFGLWAFLLGCGWFSRAWPDVLLAVVVLAFYSGFLAGFVPRQAISFEYHLAGALCGFVWAGWCHKRIA